MYGIFHKNIRSFKVACQKWHAKEITLAAAAEGDTIYVTFFDDTIKTKV